MIEKTKSGTGIEWECFCSRCGDYYHSKFVFVNGLAEPVHKFCPACEAGIPDTMLRCDRCGQPIIRREAVVVERPCAEGIQTYVLCGTCKKDIPDNPGFAKATVRPLIR